jgi:hypothetical protein
MKNLNFEILKTLYVNDVINNIYSSQSFTISTIKLSNSFFDDVILSESSLFKTDFDIIKFKDLRVDRLECLNNGCLLNS